MTEDTKTTGVSAGFDTSGTVRRPGFARPLAWSDLSPFEQGYVEALFVETRRANPHHPVVGCGFSDLAPEALVMILRDCEGWLKLYPKASGGASFWRCRQDQLVTRPDFPPLTVYLGDDGRVHLRTTQASEGAA